MARSNKANAVALSPRPNWLARDPESGSNFPVFCRFQRTPGPAVVLRLKRRLKIRRKTLRFFGTWNRQFRSSECDPLIRLACAGP